jgi:hypothetical protein
MEYASQVPRRTPVVDPKYLPPDYSPTEPTPEYLAGAHDIYLFECLVHPPVGPSHKVRLTFYSLEEVTDEITFREASMRAYPSNTVKWSDFKILKRHVSALEEVSHGKPAHQR